MNWGVIVGISGVGLAILAYARKARGTVQLKLIDQSAVTPEMTEWAENILKDGPAFGFTAARTFGNQVVVAKVEHHTKQARTGLTGDFKGVTLYVPTK